MRGLGCTEVVQHLPTHMKTFARVLKLTGRTENGKKYSSLPLDAVVTLSSEPVLEDFQS